MTRNYFKDFNLLAISANHQESALNTAQTLDTGLLVPKTLVLNVKPLMNEDNRAQANGKEEPDTVYFSGYGPSELALAFDKATPQHYAIGLAFGLGIDTPAANGSGYNHVITPTSNVTLPSMTVAGRAGLTIFERQFISMFVNTFKTTLKKNAWAQVDIGLKGTGLFNDTVIEESITAPYNSTTLTLAANAIQGSTAAARLDSIHRIRVQDPTTLEWQEVTFTAASSATPGVITINAVGGVSTSTIFKVLYQPVIPAWATLPGIVTESPLRVTNLLINYGGTWNGTTLLGGRTLGAEVNSLEYDLTNNVLLEQLPTSGGSPLYANFMGRGDRTQTIKLDKQLRDFILQHTAQNLEYFAVRATLTGSSFATGQNFAVDLVWPQCAVVQNQIKVDGKILAEAGDFKVLQNTTYGSMIATVTNQASGYAQ